MNKKVGVITGLGVGCIALAALIGVNLSSDIMDSYVPAEGINAQLELSMELPGQTSGPLVFEDVYSTSYYAEAINYLHENGVIEGYPDDTENGIVNSHYFFENDDITSSQLIDWLTNLYPNQIEFYNKDREYIYYSSNWYSALSNIKDAEGNPCDIALDQNAVCKVLMCAAGIQVFPDGMEDPDSWDHDTWMDARSHIYSDTAYAMGLIGYPEPDRIISRGEAADILYRIITDKTDANANTQAREALEAKNAKAIEILEDMNITYNQVSDHLYDYLMELARIPADIRQEFIEKGWSLKINDPFIIEYNKQMKEQNGSVATGITSEKHNRVIITMPSAIAHEYMHFMYYQMDNKEHSYIDELYKAESSNAAAILGDYSTTNGMEYIAEVMEYWLSSTDAEKDDLRSVAPETSAYIESLVG